MTAGRKNSSHLRSGYTTGACATAAAQAATLALLDHKAVESVEIDLPGGNKATFKVEKCVSDNQQVSCSVIKDAGDDPDITNRAEIWATVCWKGEPGISIEGGKGVGVVTKPGLEIPVGMAAINPVPRQMIAQAVKKAAGACLDSQGTRVIISVTGGEKLTKKTLNPRLGIIGGISILGTTGIVIPYSLDAYKACIPQSLDVAVACGCRQVVFATGRRSEKFAQKTLPLGEECFVLVGDFIDYALEACARRELGRAIIWGMAGKISKLAAGHIYTHISSSRVDINFLAGVAASCGLSEETAKVLEGAVSANHLLTLLPPKSAAVFCNKLCLLAAQQCRQHAGGGLEVECIMSDRNGSILGRANA